MLLPRYRTDPPTPRRLGDHLRQLETQDELIRAAPGAPPDQIERLQRRLIPIIGGVAGVAPGTDPVRELLRKEAQRRTIPTNL